MRHHTNHLNPTINIIPQQRYVVDINISNKKREMRCKQVEQHCNIDIITVNMCLKLGFGAGMQYFNIYVLKKHVSAFY